MRKIKAQKMINLEFKGLPRDTTRKQWKEMHRWKRMMNKVVEKEMEKNAEAFEQAVTTAMAYGTVAIKHRHDGRIEVVNVQDI